VAAHQAEQQPGADADRQPGDRSREVGLGMRLAWHVHGMWNDSGAQFDVASASWAHTTPSPDASGATKVRVSLAGSVASSVKVVMVPPWAMKMSVTSSKLVPVSERLARDT
jgi:hypothetical protein